MSEKTFESPLNCKEIKPVNPKGNQFWIFIGKPDAKAEAPILWPPYVKSWLIRKAPDAGKDWRRVEKGTIEDEMVGWHHRLNGCEFEQVLGDGDGQRRLVCCNPWDHKELDTAEWTTTQSTESFFVLLLNIYLATPGLSCCAWDLQSYFQHEGSLVAACKLLVAACGI